MLMIKRRKRNPLEKFWSHVQEPKAITLTMSFAYALAVMVGTAVLWDVRTPMDFIHGILFISGGPIGVFSSISGYYDLERIAILLCSAGALTWFFGLGLHYNAIGTLMVLAFFATRWLRIRDFGVTPGEPLVEVPGITR
ncbi:hypothetical protein QP786_06485 [Gleimia europaea]|nr:hypothetical protein [Gleimia europaea]